MKSGSVENRVERQIRFESKLVTTLANEADHANPTIPVNPLGR